MRTPNALESEGKNQNTTKMLIFQIERYLLPWLSSASYRLLGTCARVFSVLLSRKPFCSLISVFNENTKTRREVGNENVGVDGIFDNWLFLLVGVHTFGVLGFAGVVSELF